MVLPLPFLATLVDFGGTLVVLTAVLRCLWNYVRAGGAADRADALRRSLAQGLVLALTFKTGAGLIRTAAITTPSQFGHVAVIIALRFLLGRVAKSPAQTPGFTPGPAPAHASSPEGDRLDEITDA